MDGCDSGKDISDEAMREGFAAARWPGRLQWMHWQGQSVRVDGAHNPPAAAALASERCRWLAADQAQSWVLAIQAHKQAPAMLKHLLQPNDQAWIIPVPEHRSWSLEQLQLEVPDLAHQLRGAADATEALNQLEHEVFRCPRGGRFAVSDRSSAGDASVAGRVSDAVHAAMPPPT